jgi:hypothetical protein
VKIKFILNKFAKSCFCSVGIKKTSGNKNNNNIIIYQKGSVKLAKNSVINKLVWGITNNNTSKNNKA